MFNPAELAEIQRLLDDARAQGRAETARTLSGLLGKLRAFAGGSTSPPHLDLFEEVLPASEACEPVTAAQVRRALERHEPIRIRYRANRSGEVTTRRIRPFNIHFYNGQEYVEAFCELRGSDRIFALASIERVLDDDASEAGGQDQALSQAAEPQP